MLSLVGDGDNNQFNDTVLRELFLQQMPTSARPILVSLGTLELSALAEVADKIVEATPPMGVAALTTPKPTSSSAQSGTDALLHSLLEKMDQLLSTSNASNNHQKRNRSRSRGPQDSSSKLCWYHMKFGDRANKCVAPCTAEKNPSRLQK
ncbi:hypothetical protein Zmor_011097 [Zophobas morio]|uniref:Uncharacterized protein n=1 Tax=Zophobas morio TaxID=2755281 RepID=A0AA38MKL8_9CUCU|nr:hypothetical protein Zmor_011097 [Zophobas morio]